MMAAATLQLSTGLELLTPALPMMFLPLAATANIGPCLLSITVAQFFEQSERCVSRVFSSLLH